MANIVDNLIAFRILYALVTPFEKTEAFKRGVVDAEGKILVKVKDRTAEQKDAYDMLDRLVFSLKRLIGKLPGGQSQIASLAAAYYLVKESYQSGVPLNEQRVKNILTIVNEGVTLVEEQLMVEKFLKEMEGGAIANAAGSATATDKPVVRLNKKNKPISGIIGAPSYIARRNKKITPMG